ncbi:MAG: zinc-ribbon domain-containing protein, partial [Clostridia bacterium]
MWYNILEVIYVFCPKCGKMNPDDRDLCSGCGAVLHEPKPEQPKKKKGLAARIAA